MFRRAKRDQADFSEELRAHLALEADRLRAEGLSQEDAYARARRNLGNITHSEERFYEAGRWLSFDHLRQDVRHALRQLGKNKGFTFVALLTLALSIGANTAIFTLTHAVMFRALPVGGPKQLYMLGDGKNCCDLGGYDQGNYTLFSYPLYKHLRDQTPEFEELAAFQTYTERVPVRRSGDTVPAQPFVREFVSGNYFSMFAVQALYGRSIVPRDDVPGAAFVAVMSYRTWQQYYSSDFSVIGSSFTINGQTTTIAGIAPPGFFGDTLRSDPPDFWMPLAAEPAGSGQNSLLNRPNRHWLYVIGRLKAGTQTAAAEAKLNSALRQWLTDVAGSNPGVESRKTIARQRIQLTSASGGVEHMKNSYADGLYLLMTVSGLVLLIACANIANLLLARGTANRIQTAMRIALGAPRKRIIGQMLTESVVLALLGGAAGLFVAYTATRAILLLAFRGSHYIPISANPSIPVLAFAFLLSLVTGIAFGVVPAWIASHSDPAEALRGANRSSSTHSSLPQKSLVVLQAVLSLVLLTDAGLLTESLRNLEHQQFGFETDGRLIVSVHPSLTGYSRERISLLYQQLRQRLENLPGVLSASLSGYSPMQGNNWNQHIFVEGLTNQPSTSLDRVSPRYFETIGTRLLRGREFREQDTQSTPHLAVVNQTFAKRNFGDEDAIGRHLGLEQSDEYEIVGIVEDAKYQNAYKPAYPTVFLPLLQMPPNDWAKADLPASSSFRDIELHIVGRMDGSEQRIRQALADLDPNLTVINVRSFGEQVSATFNQERLIARLTELFGLLALILASLGLYGVTAYSVVRRTSEIGIRISLGATRTSVMSMVLRDGFLQVAIGLLIGVPVVVAASHLLGHRLYGVKSYDPAVLGGAILVLATCALIAGFVPARRATTIDPMRALRTE